ncbi:MAG: DUF4115 domain-containing protein [Gammaproteobacteria bacterium]|nr:DUF4115 domain-containing protein [Gammaproteobacteria bacterium]
MTESDPKRPGEVLRARREALDVTVREVAETLNLSMAMIEALEADDASKLPGTVFARGYVRAYARLLELDPKPLLEYYPKTEVAEPAGEVPSEPPIWEWIRRRPALVLGCAGGALVMLLVLVLVLVWPEDGEDVDSTVAEDAAARTQPGLLAERDPAQRDTWPAAPEPGPGAEQTYAPAGAARPGSAEGSPPAAGASAAADSAPAGGPTPATSPAQAARSAQTVPDAAPDTALAGAGFETAANAAPETEGGARRITAVGDDRLAFGFSDDCWVEVKNASGANLYSDLNRAGSELELVGEGPFRILLGYAPGARLTFNGEPVPLAPHTRNNVATLVLGQ